MTSTAQADWDDQHRNHELAPKEADTAEPMSAEERGKTVEREMRLLWSENRVDEITAFFAEQIRQAEQAARLVEREKALEEAAQAIYPSATCGKTRAQLANMVRALKAKA